MTDQQPPVPPHDQPTTPIERTGASAGQTPPPAPQQPPGQPQQAPAPEQKTNTLAIVALISSFFISVLGIILGHIALSKIKKTGEGGRGLALAGTIIGYVLTLVWIIVIVVSIVASMMFVAAVNEQIEEVGADALPEVIEDLEGLSDTLQQEEILAPQDDGERPWVDTAHAEYCDLFVDSYFAVVDPDTGRLEQLSATAPTPELQQYWSELATLEDIETAEPEEAFELLAAMPGIIDESTRLCYEGSQ